MFDLVNEVREVSALNFLSKTHTWAKVGVPVNGVELKGCTWYQDDSGFQEAN